MNSKSFKNQNEAKERAIHDAREKLKNIIKKNNKFNLRDLSRILKKNDAYLQQYLFRGTPKILPEETRFRLSQILEININDITPNWYDQNSPKEKLISFVNIDTKDESLSKKITSCILLLTSLNFNCLISKEVVTE